MEFQKLFFSCMLLNKLGLFDRVTQASLVRVLTNYNRSVHLSMADSPLAAESRSMLSHRLANRASLFLTVFQVLVALVPLTSTRSVFLVLSLEQERLAT